MRRSGKGSGGGIGMNKVVHRPHGKTEPFARTMRVEGVGQLGQKQGSHITSEKGESDTGYRGEKVRGGPGYNPPLGITDPVKAVGVGGGRTIHSCGSQGLQGSVNPGNPPPNRYRDALEQE